MGTWEEEEMGNEKSENADEGRKGRGNVAGSSLNPGPQVTAGHSAGMSGSTWLTLRMKRCGQKPVVEIATPRGTCFSSR